MTREELFQIVELLRDTAKFHQPNEEILTDVKAESFVFVMDSVLSTLSIPEREKGTDLISRKEAVFALNEAQVEYDEYYKGLGKAKAIIDSLPSAVSEREKGEWIPVSERLPEKNVWVLVTVEQSGSRYQEIMRRNNYKEGWTDNIDFYTDEISAWQPLPEPYKAESEDI